LADTALFENGLLSKGISFIKGERLASYTTVGLGGTADFLVVPDCAVGLLNAVDLAKACGVRYFLLGKGSNVLVSDGGFRGAVIYTGRVNDLYVERECGDTVFIRAFCGCTVPMLSAFCKRSGFTGLEFLFGIPGSIGGCVAMNAGCYGKSVGEAVVSVFASRCGRLSLYGREQCGFGYRESVFQNGESVIISALFRVKKGDYLKVSDTFYSYAAMRKSQPCGKTMGSVFKNGDIPAGKLIEDCDLKGMRVGGAFVSDRHANFIVNDGTASSSDVRDLIETVKAVVRERTGVCLKEEIKYVGEFR